MWKAQILSHESVLQRGTGDRQWLQEADQVQGLPVGNFDRENYSERDFFQIVLYFLLFWAENSMFAPGRKRHSPTILTMKQLSQDLLAEKE